MMFAEHLHSHLATGSAIELVARILPELRRDGTPEEQGFQFSNLAAYYLALDDAEAAAGLVAEAAACLPHEDSNGYWCVLQNAAHLAIAAGKMETAALLLGFVDHRFEGWVDGRQSTEVMQRQRMLTRLEEEFASAELQKLLAQGADLNRFEADVVAGFVDGTRRDGH
jgi:hypothetical protein